MGAAALTGLGLFAMSGRASAHLDSTNGCQASGTFRETGQTVDAEAIGDEVVTIHRSDSVDWQGSVAAPPGAYSGTISIDMPPPFGDAEIDSWDGESDNASNAGVKDYDLTSWVPADVEFKVVGSHSDENGSCTGYVNLKVDGGPFDSPVAPISLAGTVLTGAGLAATLRPLFRRLP
jgi:hypothetical protein